MRCLRIGNALNLNLCFVAVVTLVNVLLALYAVSGNCLCGSFGEGVTGGTDCLLSYEYLTATVTMLTFGKT